jgi:hypothetical protein
LNLWKRSSTQSATSIVCRALRVFCHCNRLEGPENFVAHQGMTLVRPYNASNISGLYSLRENSILSQGEQLYGLLEKLCFVSGHDFSRAIND